MAGELLLQAVTHVWSTLEPMGVPMALAGGLALAMWKHVRATRDVDILVELGGRDRQLLLRTLAAAGVRSRREGVSTKLGSLEVLHKLMAGRLIDRYDASILLRANRQQMDLGYLAHWARDLGIASEWAGLWQEVFPGEALPGSPRP